MKDCAAVKICSAQNSEQMALFFRGEI